MSPLATAARDAAPYLAAARHHLAIAESAEHGPTLADVQIAQALALTAIGTLVAGFVDGELAGGVGDEDQDQEPGADLPTWLNPPDLATADYGDKARLYPAAAAAAAAEFAERMRNAPRACIPAQEIHVQVLGQALCECGAVTI